MKYLLTLLTLLSIVLLAPSTVFADDNDTSPIATSSIVFEEKGVPEKQTYTENGVIYTITSQQVQQVKREIGGPSPNAASTIVVGGHTIEWANCAAQGTQGSQKVVQHCFGRTRRVAGSGNYRAEVHSTLIEGDSGGVEYGDNAVFGTHTDSCAGTGYVLNQNAQSCASSWFGSSVGQWWYIVSGHAYDVAADGDDDATCPGCIDNKYEVTP